MKPIVSVWMITYNHAPYIAQAIESVLSQQTNFPVELVIGEDCSTDGTGAIVQAYQARYPERICLFQPARNLGMMPMIEATYGLCSGRYVAWIDGDDYWTDPQKLQKQVALLDAEPDLAFVFHKADLLYESSKTICPAPTLLDADSFLYLSDFLQPSHPVITLSVVARNILGDKLPAWFFKLPYPDYGLLLLLLLKGGKATYLPDCMGVYRIHAQGAFSSLTLYKKIEDRISFLDIIKPHMPLALQHQVHQVKGYHYYELMILALRTGLLARALRYFKLMSWHDTGLVRQQGSIFHELFVAGIKSLSLCYRKLNPMV